MGALGGKRSRCYLPPVAGQMVWFRKVVEVWGCGVGTAVRSNRILDGWGRKDGEFLSGKTFG